MTSEIAVMNKSAIALAADSAMTIPSSPYPKIYNQAIKLFRLSKIHPVGIMIYGDAEIMLHPWELIIKKFRSKLGKNKFNKIEEYAKEFICYISEYNYNLNERERFITIELSKLYTYLFNLIRKSVEEKMNKKNIIKSEENIFKEIKDMTVKVINSEYILWNKSNWFEGFDENAKSASNRTAIPEQIAQ